MMLQHRAEGLSEILSPDGQHDVLPRADLFSSSFPGGERSFDCYRPAHPDGLALPHVIVPQLGDLEDLFAKVATYYPDQSPLTALVHVLSPEMASLVTQEQGPMQYDGYERQGRYRKATIGAALGEATLAALGVPDGSSALPSYSAVRRTLAFTLGRSHQLYGEQFPIKQIAVRWMRLRDITRLPHFQPSVNAVLRAHEVASDSDVQGSSRSNTGADIYLALHGFVAGHDLDGNHLESIIANTYPDAALFLRELSGVFDGRMRAFSQLIQIIQLHSRGQEIDEIAVAFVCNRILPSSFAHAGALVPLTPFFPAALVWYGFFSMLTRPSKTSSLNPGLLLKLERDLVEPFSFEQRPRCDIALEELEVLSRVAMRAEVIKPTQQRALLVGLLPGVDVYTRFGNETDPSAERNRHDADISTLHGRVADLLHEALEVLKTPLTTPSKKISPVTAARRDKKRVR